MAWSRRPAAEPRSQLSRSASTSFGARAFGRPGEAPVRNPRYGASDIRGDVAAQVEVTEKASQGADHDLRPPGADLFAGPPNVPIDIIERQRPEVEGACRKSVAEKVMCDPEAILDCDWAQSLVITQETLIPVLDHRDRGDIAFLIDLFGSEILDCTQPSQQLTPRSRHARGPLAPLSKPRVNLRGVRKIELPLLEPKVERLHQTQLGSPRARRVALACEPGVEIVQIRHKGAICRRWFLKLGNSQN